MHVAFLLPDLKGGGVQKMVINLANWFAARGVRTDLVLLSRDGLYADLISPSVQVHDFQKKRVILAMPALVRYLRAERPDVLFTAMHYMNVLALLCRLFVPSVKIVISERNDVERSLQNLSGVWCWLMGLVYPLADHVICISRGVADGLRHVVRGLRDDQVSVIYNPVVTDVFDVVLDAEVAACFPAHCKVKLITSGRLVAQKDYPTMLKAFARYLQDEPSAYLVILGQGALEADVKVLAEDLDITDSIHFAGFVHNPLAMMRQADVFLMCSAWEGFCNVIVEALYCGLQVVSTDCPSGPAEILEGGEYGFLAEVGNVQEVVMALKRASAKPFPAEVLRKRAMDFHVDVIGAQYHAVFKRLAGL